MSPLEDATGEHMTLSSYYADFEKHFWQSADLGFWKLERQQHFEEPGNASWEAFTRGDWEESMRLLEEEREEMTQYHERIAQHGFVARRIRITEDPLSDYMRWELHALNIRDQCGGPIRILPANRVAQFETDGPLPEIYTLGSAVMYQAVYGDQGRLESARKYTDPRLVLRCKDFIARLYEAGEPIEGWFGNHVSSLAPSPRPSRG